MNSFAKNAEIVHIDIDNSEINKNVTVQYNIVGEIGIILDAVMSMIEDNSHEEWLHKIDTFCVRKEINRESFTPENILKTIQDILGDDVTPRCRKFLETSTIAGWTNAD